jgi:hypothetical protein
LQKKVFGAQEKFGRNFLKKLDAPVTVLHQCALLNFLASAALKF